MVLWFLVSWWNVALPLFLKLIPNENNMRPPPSGFTPSEHSCSTCFYYPLGPFVGGPILWNTPAQNLLGNMKNLYSLTKRHVQSPHSFGTSWSCAALLNNASSPIGSIDCPAWQYRGPLPWSRYSGAATSSHPHRAFRFCSTSTPQISYKTHMKPTNQGHGRWVPM